MKPIPVLHIIGSLNLGGAEKSLYLLLKNIDLNQYPTIVVTLYSTRHDEFFTTPIEQLGIPIYQLHLKSWHDWRAFLQLRQIIKKHRIQIVHSHYGALEFYGTLFGRLAGVRNCIYTKHNVRLKTGFIFNCQRLILNRLLAKRILSISKTVTRHLLEKEFAPWRKIRLVYNPIESPKKMPRTIARQILGLPHNKLIIGNTSRYDDWKGFDIFYRTAAILIEKGIAVHTLTLTDENARHVHERLIAENRLSANASLIPFQQEMAPVYSALDFYLITSRHTEGFGMAHVEALSYGIPTISLNVGVLSEIIQDGKTGILPFPQQWQPTYKGNVEEAAQAFASSIERLINNPTKIESVRRNALSYAIQFGTATFCLKITNIYRSLCL